jgi:hypothetical protein
MRCPPCGGAARGAPGWCEARRARVPARACPPATARPFADRPPTQAMCPAPCATSCSTPPRGCHCSCHRECAPLAAWWGGRGRPGAPRARRAATRDRSTDGSLRRATRGAPAAPLHPPTPPRRSEMSMHHPCSAGGGGGGLLRHATAPPTGAGMDPQPNPMIPLAATPAPPPAPQNHTHQPAAPRAHPFSVHRLPVHGSGARLRSAGALQGPGLAYPGCLFKFLNLMGRPPPPSWPPATPHSRPAAAPRSPCS